MNSRIIKISVILVVIVLAVLYSQDIAAQCPMCKMSAESNLEHGGTEGKGLNKGILYLFSMPYLLIGGLAFLWWKNRKTEEEVFQD